VTINHGRVKACNHLAKFSATQPPKGNCVDCWKAWFMTQCDLDSLHVILTQQGAKELIKQRGVKFVKALHGFLASCLLPTLINEVNKAIPAGEPAQIQGGTFANGYERAVEND
jgi:hypothetical protein